MLQKGKLTVWSAHLDAHSEPEMFLEFLSASEKVRANKYRFYKDRAMFLMGRGILRQLLGHYTGLHPSEVQFKYGKQGKPCLQNKEGPHFNISHSGEVLVLGFCQEQPLGIDVEKIKTDFDLAELAAQHFSLLEIEALNRLNPKAQQRAFYRCWTRKESFIKAKGSGLSFPLDAFSVSIQEDYMAELLETKWRENEKEQWQLTSFIPAEGYLAAISVQDKSLVIEHRNWATFTD